eukprot:COSAG04_NODE_5722_length_1512_cov_1.086341_1_plen_178_part_00
MSRLSSPSVPVAAIEIRKGSPPVSCWTATVTSSPRSIAIASAGSGGPAAGSAGSSAGCWGVPPGSEPADASLALSSATSFSSAAIFSSLASAIGPRAGAAAAEPPRPTPNQLYLRPGACVRRGSLERRRESPEQPKTEPKVATLSGWEGAPDPSTTSEWHEVALSSRRLGLLEPMMV